MFPKLQLPLPPFPLPTGHMKHHSRYQYRSQFSPKASELILPSIRLQPRNNDINLPSIRKVLGEFITTKEYLPLPDGKDQTPLLSASEGRSQLLEVLPYYNDEIPVFVKKKYRSELDTKDDPTNTCLLVPLLSLLTLC